MTVQQWALPAEGNTETPIYGDAHKTAEGMLGHLLLLKLLSPRPNGFRTLPFATLGRGQVAHGTMWVNRGSHSQGQASPMGEGQFLEFYALQLSKPWLWFWLWFAEKTHAKKLISLSHTDRSKTRVPQGLPTQLLSAGRIRSGWEGLEEQTGIAAWC